MTTDEVRADVLFEVREILAKVHERMKAVAPLYQRMDAVTHPSNAPWREPEEAEAIANLRSAIESAAGAWTVPQAQEATFKVIGLDPMAQELERLCWLLGLCDVEGRFVTALAQDISDGVTAEVYADWLEENGRSKEGEAVRKLSPQTGDVVIVKDSERLASEIVRKARLRGREITAVVVKRYGNGTPLELATPEEMAKAGWVRQEAVEEERQRCAALIGDHTSEYLTGPERAGVRAVLEEIEHPTDLDRGDEAKSIIDSSKSMIDSSVSLLRRDLREALGLEEPIP